MAQPSCFSGRAVAVALCVLVAVMFVEAKIEKLSLTDDTRRIIVIEEFGYEKGGSLFLSVPSFKLHGGGPDGQDGDVERVGLLFSRFSPDRVVTPYDSGDRGEAPPECILDKLDPELDTRFAWGTNPPEMTLDGTIEPGKYMIVLVNCVPDSSVSLEMEFTMFNPGPDYLGVGESPLPMVYLTFGVINLGMVVVWIATLALYRQNVLKVHLFMALVVNLKTIVMFLDAIRMGYVKQYGVTSLWSLMFYIFSFIKGMFLFVVILLVGSGWSLLKPFLSDRDKKVLMIVIPLQLGSNIALAVVEEESPGTLGWVNWHDVLILFDVFCCCAILFPVAWSLKTLREGAAAEGSAASKSLKKLVIFRNFYIGVVGWVYFTRIVGMLLVTVFSYEYTYMAAVCIEASSTLFYAYTGYLFRPVENNPYLKVETSDLEMDSFSDTEAADEAAVASMVRAGSRTGAGGPAAAVAVAAAGSEGEEDSLPVLPPAKLPKENMD